MFRKDGKKKTVQSRAVQDVANRELESFRLADSERAESELIALK